MTFPFNEAVEKYPCYITDFRKLRKKYKQTKYPWETGLHPEVLKEIIALPIYVNPLMKWIDSPQKNGWINSIYYDDLNDEFILDPYYKDILYSWTDLWYELNNVEPPQPKPIEWI